MTPLSARELRDVVDRDANRIADRLVLQVDHPRQEVEQVVLRQQPLVVLGADLLRHHARVRAARS